jgi:hypothetical protein
MVTFITPPFRVIRFLGFNLLLSHQPLFAHTELATSWLSGCCAISLLREEWEARGQSLLQSLKVEQKLGPHGTHFLHAHNNRVRKGTHVFDPNEQIRNKAAGINLSMTELANLFTAVCKSNDTI